MIIDYRLLPTNKKSILSPHQEFCVIKIFNVNLFLALLHKLLTRKKILFHSFRIIYHCFLESICAVRFHDERIMNVFSSGHWTFKLKFYLLCFMGLVSFLRTPRACALPPVKNDAFQLCIQESNNLMTGVLMTSSVMLTEETPKDRWCKYKWPTNCTFYYIF